MSCAQTEKRLQEAAEAQGRLRAEQTFPEFPPDCRATEEAGLEPGMEYLAALGRYDAALSRQNLRGLRCAAWYDDNFTEQGNDE